ncbi:RHS domain-containing protein [Delftia acidovorans]|uniref:RHS domain-containing protein n=1 Tax=Delftia acidovorans TaxID=80866 RepID=UPI00241FE086|nr:RHS domain-containing protein [Delftia acidovorans]
MPLAKLESEWKSEENRNAQAEADIASFATYYYHCDQIGAPQELTDEAGRIVWAASYKVWGQTQQLQHLRTGTDDAAVFPHDQRPLALAAQGEVQSLALVDFGQCHRPGPPQAATQSLARLRRTGQPHPHPHAGWPHPALAFYGSGHLHQINIAHPQLSVQASGQPPVKHQMNQHRQRSPMSSCRARRLLSQLELCRQSHGR